MTYERIVVESEGFTVPRIIWRRFRRPMVGLFELTLSENPGLADLSPRLPVGTEFLLPIPSDDRPAQPFAVVRLWD